MPVATSRPKDSCTRSASVYGGGSGSVGSRMEGAVCPTALRESLLPGPRGALGEVSGGVDQAQPAAWCGARLAAYSAARAPMELPATTARSDSTRQPPGRRSQSPASPSIPSSTAPPPWATNRTRACTARRRGTRDGRARGRCSASGRSARRNRGRGRRWARRCPRRR